MSHDPENPANHAAHAADHAAGHVRRLYAVFLALMVLLVLTIVMAHFDLGPLNTAIALGIAVTKAVLVLLIFMHVAHSGKVVWIFSAAGFVWLGIMLALTFSDYLTRSAIPKTDPFNEHAPLAHSADHIVHQPKG